MNLPLSPDLREVLYRAAGLADGAGEELITIERLMLALAQAPGPAAASLLDRLGVRPDALYQWLAAQYGEPEIPREAILLPGLAPLAERAMRRAEAAAAERGERCVTTAHLLLGLAEEPRSGTVLAKHRIDAATLREAMEGLAGSAEAAAPLRPLASERKALQRVLLLATACLTLRLLAAMLPALYGLLLLAETPAGLLVLAWAAYIGGIPLAVVGPLHRGVRRAWSWTLASLLFDIATLSALLMFVLWGVGQAGNPVTVAAAAVAAVLPLAYLALAVPSARGLFRHHDWYGVGHRQAWRTMTREGGWIIVVGLLLLSIILLGPVLLQHARDH